MCNVTMAYYLGVLHYSRRNKEPEASCVWRHYGRSDWMGASSYRDAQRKLDQFANSKLRPMIHHPSTRQERRKVNEKKKEEARANAAEAHRVWKRLREVSKQKEAEDELRAYTGG